jgi:hypothetical protein
MEVQYGLRDPICVCDSFSGTHRAEESSSELTKILKQQPKNNPSEYPESKQRRIRRYRLVSLPRMWGFNDARGTVYLYFRLPALFSTFIFRYWCMYHCKIPLITWKSLEFRDPTNGGKKEARDASRKRQ